MSKAGKTGVTTNTPKNILFGAGTIHKNLTYTAGTGGASGSWNFEDSIIGATSGGSKVTITPEITTVEADGALVKVKGLDVKTGEVAEMEINFLEMTKDIIKSAVIGTDGTSADSTYDLENIAFVGKTLGGKKIIFIMDNALCTSGLESEGANKEAGVGTYTFACYAELDSDLDTLPDHIYYPKATT